MRCQPIYSIRIFLISPNSRPPPAILKPNLISPSVTPIPVWPPISSLSHSQRIVFRSSAEVCAPRPEIWLLTQRSPCDLISPNGDDAKAGNRLIDLSERHRNGIHHARLSRLHLRHFHQ